MTFKSKSLVALMVSSIIIAPLSAEARKPPPSKKKAPQDTKILNEHRPEHRSPYGGTLVWGVAHKPTIINPILTQTSVSTGLMELIFDPLVKIDHRGEIIRGLAKSWDISKDGLVYTFYLQKGVLFHDGIELTAEDVKFTYDQINDPINQSHWKPRFELNERWEIVDDYTLKMTLKEPFDKMLYKLVREIAPKHLLEGKNLYTADFNYFPIGTGPFMFKNWDKETNQIELRANPHYFEGRPYLNKVIVKTYSGNSQLWAAFMRREVDLVQYINQNDYSVIKNDPAFEAYTIPGDMYFAIVYNVQDPIWHDKELRRAIAYAIDKREIIDNLPGVGGEECTGPFHPEFTGYNHKIQPITYDPIRAKMMLMHRGWLDMKADAYNGELNIRKKNGRELELRMLVDERNDMYKKIAKMIRQQLSEIGVKLIILFYKEESELTKEYLDRYKPHAWLRLFLGLGSDANTSIGSLYSLSFQIGRTWPYKNEEVDNLFKLADITDNKNNKADIYNKIHKIIYDEQPACFLFFPTYYSGINSDFKNTDNYFKLYMPTYTIKDWYVSKN